MIDRVIASNLVVPLIGTGSVIEQHYASAPALANEQTIADAIERLIDKPGPQLDPANVLNAIDAKAAEIGRPLTPGQTTAVEAVCSSGRAVEVIVGIAGSGKTTALDAAATALEHAGYTVVGTATSGQAARTLGHAAGIESRTMRSLLWRLDHHQIALDDKTIVILDEAGMTADADLARLLLAIERTGAKVVLVGDDRQLSAVGPGGALAAMLARHTPVVTELTENLRQRDPAERAALDQLRHGDIHQAIDFYTTHDRIHVAAGRVETLAHMVERWAADVAAGHDTTMLARQRANVAALNRIARAQAQHRGWITGPELQAPGGRGYAVGDPVVLLAPNREGDLVTSQRATVTAVDLDRQALTLLVDDRRHVTVTGEAEHLDHGYAITVHRQQGATSDRTHYFADGGGRELAYVALSRARDRSTIHAVADDLEQAIEHITYDWNQEQHQQWVTDTHQPGTDPKADPLPAASRTEQIAQLRREIQQLQQQRPPDVTTELTATATATQLHQLETDRTNLTTAPAAGSTSPKATQPANSTTPNDTSASQPPAPKPPVGHSSAATPAASCMTPTTSTPTPNSTGKPSGKRSPNGSTRRSPPPAAGSPNSNETTASTSAGTTTTPTTPAPSETRPSNSTASKPTRRPRRQATDSPIRAPGRPTEHSMASR